MRREGFLRLAFAPLRRIGDCAGRSTRSELLAYYFLVRVFGLLTDWAAGELGDWRTSRLWAFVFALPSLVPLVPLMIRRLHDSGLSGWWILLGAPVVPISAWRELGWYREPLRMTPGPWDSLWLQLPAGLAFLVLLFLLISNDDPEANRYGPNPRYEPGPEAQLA